MKTTSARIIIIPLVAVAIAVPLALFAAPVLGPVVQVAYVYSIGGEWTHGDINRTVDCPAASTAVLLAVKGGSGSQVSTAARPRHCSAPSSMLLHRTHHSTSPAHLIAPLRA